jgi:hypothetical protein
MTLLMFPFSFQQLAVNSQPKSALSATTVLEEARASWQGATRDADFSPLVECPPHR